MFGGRVDRGGGREGKGKSLRKNKIALNEMAKQAAKPERAPQGTTKSHPATLLPSTHRMAFIDAGCHIVNRQFDRDQLKVLQRSQMCGAQALIAITTDFEKTEQAIDVAKQNSGFVYVSVGLHSDNVKRNNDKTISTRLEQVREFALKPEVVSLSCSIDFTRDIAIRYAQEKVVESHLDIAGELNMPIILQEIGGASEALLEQISAYRGKKWQNDPLAAAMQLLSSSDSSSSAAPVPAAAPASGTVENRRVAIYDFCGTQAELLAYLSYDCYIILSGGMCDDGAKYKQLVDILRPKGVAEDDSSWTPLLPRHRLLIATDSPFKTPQCIADLHIRESRNEPANMPEILQALAKIYRITPAEMAAQVTANSKEFFWLDERDREVVDPTAPAAAAASAPASAPSTAAPAAGGKKSATSAAAPAAEAEKGKGKGAGKAGGKKEEEEDVKGGKKGGKGGKKKKGDDEDDEEEEEIKPSKSQRKGNKKKGKHDDDFSDEDEGKGRKGRAGKKMDLSALEDEIEALGKKGKKKGKQMKKEESESEEESEEEKEVEKPQKGAVPVHVDDDEDEEDEDEHVHKSEEEEEDEEEEHHPSPSTSTPAPAPAPAPESSPTDAPKSQLLLSEIKYNCKMCRKVLFTAADLVEHDATSTSRADFKGAKGKSANSGGQGTVCQNIFVKYAMKWMSIKNSIVLSACAQDEETAEAALNRPEEEEGEEEDEEDELEGKLSCPHCDAKIGRWSFCDSIPCSCGLMMPPPVFKVMKNRLDVTCDKLDVEAAMRASLQSYFDQPEDDYWSSSEEEGGRKKKRNKMKRSNKANFSSFRNKSY